MARSDSLQTLNLDSIRLIESVKSKLASLSRVWQHGLLLAAKACFLLTCFFIPLSTTLTDICFSLAAGFSLMSGKIWQQRQFWIKFPVTKVLFSAALIIIVGLFYSFAPVSAALSYSKKYLWLFLTPFLFVLVDNPRFKSYALYSFLTAMILTLLLSYLDYFDFSLYSFHKGEDSIFKDHIIQNFLMAITGMIFLLKVKDKGFKSLIYFILFLLVAIDILFFCEGRIGYLLLPFVIFYSWVVTYGWRHLFFPFLIIFGLFIIALVFSHHLQDRVLDAFQNLETYNSLSQNNNFTSIGIRRTMLGLGIKIIEGRPLLGYGTGSIYTVLHGLPDSWIIGKEWVRTINTFENAYLHIGIQFGILGLSLFFWGCIYLWRKSSHIVNSFFKASIRGVFIAMAIGFFFNPWLESTTEKHFLAIFLVICFEYPMAGDGRRIWENKVSEKL